VESGQIGLSLRFEPNQVRKAFREAKVSGQPLERLSYQAELAHIGFWISEFKPVTVQPPMKFSTVMHKAKLYLHETIVGGGADQIVAEAKRDEKNAPFRKEYKEAERIYARHATAPISERISALLIISLISAEVRRRIGLLKTPTVEEHLLQHHTEFIRKVIKDGVLDKVVEGLRYHIFTPQSFTTLIESIFAFEPTLGTTTLHRPSGELRKK